MLQKMLLISGINLKELITQIVTWNVKRMSCVLSAPDAQVTHISVIILYHPTGITCMSNIINNRSNADRVRLTLQSVY